MFTNLVFITLGLMSTGKAGAGCNIFDDERKIIVAAGATTRWKTNLAVEVYDIDSNSWSRVQSIPSAGAWITFTIGSHFAASSRGTDLSIHLFHPENGTWSALPHKAVPKPEPFFPQYTFAIHSDEMPNKCSLG